MGEHGQLSPYAQRLRTRRRELGLTQTQLAQRAGVGQDVISRIERAEYTGSDETVHALADALQTDAAELLALARQARDPIVLAVQRSDVLDDEEKGEMLRRYTELLAAHGNPIAAPAPTAPVPVAVTVEQAAEMLAVGVSTVAKLIAEGELTAASFGARSYRVTVASIDAYVARQCEARQRAEAGGDST